MTPRAALAADRFTPDQLVLRVSETYDPKQLNLYAYDEFIEAIARGRDYQADTTRATLRFLCGGRYATTTELARESYQGSADLQRRYATEQALIDELPFPDMLSASLDLATGTGKSFVMYSVARVMLNEGIVDRVLVLAPSLTIEAGLLEKFRILTADAELTDLLPERPSGHPIPTIVDAGSTVQEGEICVENIHAAYERTGSSLADSFTGRGDRTLVISDEAHHVVSGGAAARRRWHGFIDDERYGFRFHVGVSGTCYVGNDYFPDVISRYAIRDAIDDGWVKEVFYLAEDDSATDHERFQKLLAQHEKNRRSYRPLKPLTIAVTKDITAAKKLREALVAFLAEQKGVSNSAANARVLIVTSAAEHKANILRLATVDEASDPTEWIVSVSMLTEGWDVKNVFQIYPHEQRAFNSKLLISQVLGRGLRRPETLDQQPTVYVFNHQRWAPRIDDYVAEILDQETTIAQRPAKRPAPHFEIHSLVMTAKPTGVAGQELSEPKKLTSLRLHPQIDADEDTKFVSATDTTRAEVLTTKVIEKRYETEVVVEEVRQRLRDHDKRTGGELAQRFTKPKVRQMITSALKNLGLDGKEVSQENRQIILNSFGGLRQRRVVPQAKLINTPTGLATIKTEDMRPVHERISRLTSTLALYYDEDSAALGEAEDEAALTRAVALENEGIAVNLHEVANAFEFKSPTNVVLASHNPERQFIRRLVHPRNTKHLRSWVKAPDTGFYGIEFAYQEAGIGRSKRGTFNPDFFLWLEATDLIAVVETKMNDDDSWVNKGKLEAARAHFKTINEMLQKKRAKRRYSFHLLGPQDYDRFFETLREGDLTTFRSTLEATLDAKQPATNGKAAAAA